MLKRFTFGLAVGYVLGARAGEKRYQQIKGLFDRALDQPAVTRVVESGREFADDRGRDLVEVLKDRASGMLDRAMPDREATDGTRARARSRRRSDEDTEAEDDDEMEPEASEEEEDEGEGRFAAEEGDEEEGEQDEEPDQRTPGPRAGRQGRGDDTRRHRPDRRTSARRQDDSRRDRRERRGPKDRKGRLSSFAAAARDRGRVD